MSLKQRWYRYLYHLERRRQDKKIPAEHVAGVRVLMVHLSRLAPSKRHRDYWTRLQIVSRWRTVDGFLQHLSISAELMSTGKYVLEPGKLMTKPTQIRLYDYFITEDNRSLTWNEVVEATLRTAEQFLKALDASGGNDEIRHDYYMRKYAHLIEALYYFAQVLCDLAVRE